jgi:hypothetical protein
VKLAAHDRMLVRLISRAYPPALKVDPPPDPGAVDWAAVIARAERQALAPLLFDSLKKTGRLQEIPAPLRLEFRGAYLRSANQSEENFRELAALLDALAEAQIPVILLKGSALAVALYDRIAQRPMCDLDFLIPKDALPRVMDVLGGRGYVGYRNLGRGFDQEFRSQLCFVRPDASRLTVDPHWHLFNSPADAEKIPVEWFWRHAEPVDIRGRQARMLSPMAALLHLSAHYYLHHQGIGLRPLYDIARLLTRGSDRIDGDELTETARSFGLLWAVQNAVREVTAIWQVPLPERFSPEAGFPGRPPSAETAIPSRYVHHLRDLNGLAGWKARLIYLWILIFPSREFLRQRYGMRQERLAGLYYAYRIVRGLAGLPGLLWAVVRHKRKTSG